MTDTDKMFDILRRRCPQCPELLVETDFGVGCVSKSCGYVEFREPANEEAETRRGKFVLHVEKPTADVFDDSIEVLKKVFDRRVHEQAGSMMARFGRAIPLPEDVCRSCGTRYQHHLYGECV